MKRNAQFLEPRKNASVVAFVDFFAGQVRGDEKRSLAAYVIRTDELRYRLEPHPVIVAAQLRAEIVELDVLRVEIAGVVFHPIAAQFSHLVG